MRCCCAARATSTTLDAYRRFVDEIVGRRNARNAQAASSSSAPALQAAAGAPDDRLRGGDRHRHLDQRLHPAQGVLHGALAPDRPPPARAPLRRPARMLPRRDAADDAARAAGRIPAASTAMSSTTATSSMPCAASRWRCSTWSIASSSSPAAPISAPSRRCWPATARSAACRTMVGLLALAHERACEAELAAGHRRRARRRQAARSQRPARTLRARSRRRSRRHRRAGAAASSTTSSAPSGREMSA